MSQLQLFSEAPATGDGSNALVQQQCGVTPRHPDHLWRWKMVRDYHTERKLGIEGRVLHMKYITPHDLLPTVNPLLKECAA